MTDTSKPADLCVNLIVELCELVRTHDRNGARQRSLALQQRGVSLMFGSDLEQQCEVCRD